MTTNKTVILKRLGEGRCPDCNVDLDDGDRCPECGEAFEHAGGGSE